MFDISDIYDGTFSGTPPAPAGVAITATRDSTNIIDLLVARDLGAGTVLSLHVQVLEAFATLTSLDIEFKVAATSGGSYFTLLAEKAIPVAQLIVGAPIFRYALPLNQVFNATAGVLKAPGRYCKFVYTVNGSNATAGKVFTYQAPLMDRQQTYIYPENYVTA